MKIFKRTEILFATAGILMFCFCFFFLTAAIDLNIHDIYFVISPPGTTLLSGLVFLIPAAIYFVFFKSGKPIGNKAGIIHFAVSVTCWLVFALALLYVGKEGRSANLQTVNTLVAISALAYISAQLFFIGNIIYTILKSKPLNN